MQSRDSEWQLGKVYGLNALKTKCTVDMSADSAKKINPISQLDSDAALAAKLSLGEYAPRELYDPSSAVAMVAESDSPASHFSVSICVVDEKSSASFWVNSRLEVRATRCFFNCFTLLLGCCSTCCCAWSDWNKFWR